MCSWCTLHTFIHLCYTTIVFNTRLKEGDFLPTSFEVILAFTLSMLCLKINWPQRKKVTLLKFVFELLMPSGVVSISSSHALCLFAYITLVDM